MEAAMTESSDAHEADETVAFEAGSLTFRQWMRKVNAEIDGITDSMGLTSKDFADWNYAYAFEEGVEPRQAAIDALAEDDIGKQYLEAADLLDEVS
jgi:hypothetical protein